MFASFLAASGKAKLLNVSHFLIILLSWIMTCVSFGGVLQVGHNSATDTDVDMYYNKAHFQDQTKDYSDLDNDQVSFASACNHGGKGLVAMQVFAFLALLPMLFMIFIRISGLSLSFLEPAKKSVNIEFILTAACTFLFFLSVCIWGGTCFRKTGSADNYSVKGTGFGFLIFCFFCLIGDIGIMLTIKRDPEAHLGSGSSQPDGFQPQHDEASTTPYQPPQTYQYAGPAPGAYAGYQPPQTDVMPAQEAPPQF